MDNAEALLAELERRGIRFTLLPGGRFFKAGPAQKLTDTDRANLSRHKPDLIRLLTQRPPGFTPGWYQPRRGGTGPDPRDSAISDNDWPENQQSENPGFSPADARMVHAAVDAFDGQLTSIGPPRQYTPASPATAEPVDYEDQNREGEHQPPLFAGDSPVEASPEDVPNEPPASPSEPVADEADRPEPDVSPELAEDEPSSDCAAELNTEAVENEATVADVLETVEVTDDEPETPAKTIPEPEAPGADSADDPESNHDGDFPPPAIHRSHAVLVSPAPRRAQMLGRAGDDTVEQEVQVSPAAWHLPIWNTQAQSATAFWPGDQSYLQITIRRCLSPRTRSPAIELAVSASRSATRLRVLLEGSGKPPSKKWLDTEKLTRGEYQLVSTRGTLRLTILS